MSFDNIFSLVFALLFVLLFAYAAYRINKTNLSKDLK